MSGDTATVIISGVVSLTSAFGSILLKDHLDLRREQRKAAAQPPAAPARAPEPTAAPPSPAKPAPSIWDADVAPAATRAPVPAASATPGVTGRGPSSSRPPPPNLGLAEAPTTSPDTAARHASASTPLPKPRSAALTTARRGSTIRAAVILAGGFVLGNFMASQRSMEIRVAIFLTVVVGTLALLVYFIRPGHRSLLGYLLGALSLWAAFIGGFSARIGSVSDGTMTVCYIFSGIIAVVGLVAFALTYRWGRRARP